MLIQIRLRFERKSALNARIWALVCVGSDMLLKHGWFGTV